MDSRQEGGVLPRSFYGRGALDVARDLLGRTLYRQQGDDLLSGVIVETEAYRGALDDASHAYRGRTPRTEVMFGSPGHAYVYLIYGMWNCMNVVCAEEGVAEAVLIRAVVPQLGQTRMRENRPGTRPLADGPGKLCQAMGITRAFDGTDLLGEQLWVGSEQAALDYLATPRIGIDYATQHRDEPWRFIATKDSIRGLSRG